MHELVMCLIKATSKQEARKKATKLLIEACENGLYDFFILFDEKDERETLRGRWGDIEPVMPFESHEAQEFLSALLLEAEEKRREALVDIQEKLQAYGMDNLVTVRDAVMELRRACVKYAQIEGEDHKIISPEGSFFFGEEIDEWASEPRNKKERLWVVPADVHC